MDTPNIIDCEDKTTASDLAAKLLEQRRGETALDRALRDTFPASDPVSIQTIYRPEHRKTLLTKPDKTP